MEFDEQAPFQVFTLPFRISTVLPESLWSSIALLNVHNKCSASHCTPQTFAARHLVWEHVVFMPVMNQQNGCDDGYGGKKKRLLQLRSATAAVTLEYLFQNNLVYFVWLWKMVRKACISAEAGESLLRVLLMAGFAMILATTLQTQT